MILDSTFNDDDGTFTIVHHCYLDWNNVLSVGRWTLSLIVKGHLTMLDTTGRSRDLTDTTQPTDAGSRAMIVTNGIITIVVGIIKQ